MQKNRWQEIEKIFNRAAALPAGERHRFVEKECSADAKLCREVLLLIDSDGKENGILDQPIFTPDGAALENEFQKLLEASDFSFYKLQILLGRGGSGAVFLAQDMRLDRPVALKILPKSLTESRESVLRFQKEARAASAISHQNIAHIYEFGSNEGRYYLAMEYVRGRTLREFVEEKQLDELRALDFALQIAAALEATHRNGIVHRDIKPENVVIADDGLVKVLDFGLAKSTGKTEFDDGVSVKTAPGMIIGTTAYMSPEQARGQHVDERTDIWSLGVVLYEMLAFARPFQGETASDLQASILRDEMPPLPKTVSLRREFCSLLEKCLQKNRLERYRSVSEFIEDAAAIQKKLADGANDSTRRWETRDWLLKIALPLTLAIAAAGFVIYSS